MTPNLTDCRSISTVERVFDDRASLSDDSLLKSLAPRAVSKRLNATIRMRNGAYVILNAESIFTRRIAATLVFRVRARAYRAEEWTSAASDRGDYVETV